MPVILDKTIPVEGHEYINPAVAGRPRFVEALGWIKLGLQKSPIYRGNARNTAENIKVEAEGRIGGYLKAKGIQCELKCEKRLSDLNPKFSVKDSVDLFVRLGAPIDLNVVIEFDAGRADQVAKKFVSRVAVARREELVYVACCYPGTASMQLPEVKKYFGYMKEISEALGLAGFIGMAPPRNVQREWGMAG